MSATKECLRCRGPMEPGFLIDRRQHSQMGTQTWVEGEPEHSFWLGLKTRGREKLPVRTYRCERCGYLESYAE